MKVVIICAILAFAFAAESLSVAYDDDTTCTAVTITAAITAGATNSVFGILADCTAGTTLSSVNNNYDTTACSYTSFEIEYTDAATDTAIAYKSTTQPSTAAGADTIATLGGGFATAWSGVTCTMGTVATEVPVTCTGATTAADKDTSYGWSSVDTATLTSLTMSSLACSDSSAASEVTLGLSALAAVLF